MGEQSVNSRAFAGGPKRSRRSRASTVRAAQIAARLRQGAETAWCRWEGTYAPLLGGWLPALGRTPSRKLMLLCDVVLAVLVAQIGAEAGGSWLVDLETTDDGAPVAVLVDWGNGLVSRIPCSIDGAVVRIAGYAVNLRAQDAGERILNRLADEIAAAVVRTPTRAAL